MGDRILRCVNKDGVNSLMTFLSSRLFDSGQAEGLFPRTWTIHAPLALGNEASGEFWLEHQKLDFPIYAHEWIPDQLYDAANTTLDLAERAMEEGLELKDATPFNILFEQGKPVFCDLLSFDLRAGGKIWRPYAQFQRTFVLPLYMAKKFGLPSHRTFLDRRDGLDPTEVRRAVRGLQALRPFELQVITLPALLSRRAQISGFSALNPESSNQASAKNDFVIRSALRRLRKQLRHVRPDEESNTVWAKYDQACDHYSEQERRTKHSFVTDALAICKAKSVLDIGANAGEYSRLAAKAGARVVAADFDMGALQRLYRQNAVERLPITPMVLNIARPTPAVGWRNSEIASFLDRAKGNFDLVLMLAVLHHLLVSERVPLKEIIRLLEDLDAKFLLIEWISLDDPKFRQIAGGDLHWYRDLNESMFRKEICVNYSVIAERAIAEGRRRLFLCERA